MMLNKMKVLVGVMALLAGKSAYSRELDLVCVDASNGQYKVRQVIIGEERVNRTLEDSYGQKVAVPGGQLYAVMIQLIPGSGLEPAREIWSVLEGNQFQLKSTGNQEWLLNVRDSRGPETFQCQPNHYPRTNPAVSRNG